MNILKTLLAVFLSIFILSGSIAAGWFPFPKPSPTETQCTANTLSENVVAPYPSPYSRWLEIAITAIEKQFNAAQEDAEVRLKNKIDAEKNKCEAKSECSENTTCSFTSGEIKVEYTTIIVYAYKTPRDLNSGHNPRIHELKRPTKVLVDVKCCCTKPVPSPTASPWPTWIPIPIIWPIPMPSSTPNPTPTGTPQSGAIVPQPQASPVVQQS